MRPLLVLFLLVLLSGFPLAAQVDLAGTWTPRYHEEYQDRIPAPDLGECDQATMVEHFIRHGDYLTHVSIMTGPVYLTEPLIRTDDFALEKNYEGSWLFPCESVVDVANRPKGEVPACLPGENKFIAEFTSRYGISEKAAMGGAETMCPEYRLGAGLKEISTGDIFSTESYPAIDISRGGSVQGIIDGLNRIVTLAGKASGGPDERYNL